jgi:cyclophilin family peptidyl-prolyl cis-trans isomerase
VVNRRLPEKYMKKIFLIAFIFALSACTADNSKMLTEKTATPDMLPVQDVIEPVAPIDNNTNNANKQSTMINPRTSINQGLELRDLAAEYTGAIIKTNLGDIEVKFYGEESPLTVNNFLNLSDAGFYNGTRFHRIIKDFMIQGGDPNSKDVSKKSVWGTGGPEYRFKDEFNSKPLVRGSLAMANSGPATNGSQFFIVTLEATPWLDGKHTNFGEVVSGMDIVDKIEASETDATDKPLSDVLINSIELVK